MQEEVRHLLKGGNHLALSNRQHLNGFTRMLPDPGPVHFLYPMRHRIFVGGILCAKELIREGVKIDRRTIRSYEDHRITLAKRIGPTGTPIILDGSLPKDGRDILSKRFPVEHLV